MALVYFCLGSNLGQREEHFCRVMEEIEKRIGPVMARSSFYETEAWGYESTNKFLNACIAVKTTLSPANCLLCIKETELLLGRLKSAEINYMDRVIDIDIIFYDDLVMDEPGLVIPHPKMQDRPFVLTPLYDIAPDFVHPVFLKTIRTLLNEINSQP